jgi:hypothetical protein
MIKLLTKARKSISTGRYNSLALTFLLAFVLLSVPGVAHAGPFDTATSASQQFARTFATFALAVGAIGMISCLLLGFFGKLNWKWVATGVGVSFGIAIVTPAITWLNGLGA